MTESGSGRQTGGQQGGGQQRKPAQRQREIADRVLAEGSASAADLAERFQVSLMTIHRDLDELERQGIVRKFRGGVTAQPSGVFESNVAFRMKSRRAEKDAVARTAVEEVEPGMAVMLDDSTTTLALVPHLENVSPLTVVTNFLEGMNRLAEVRGVRLLGLGGDYDPMHNSFLGVSCIEAVQSLRVDVCFTSTSAVSGAYAFHQEQHIVSVKRAMIESAARNVLLLDNSKLGRVALHKLAPLSAFDLVVVDSGVSEEALRDLEEHKVNYKVAAL